MPRNGSGQYDLPYDWNDDKINGIKVLASRMQAQDEDIGTALTNSLSKDGQTPLTGNLDFNNNKAVDLANGSNLGDAINVSQAQTGELQFYGVSTTTPAGTNGEDYDIAPFATIATYPSYVRFSFICHFTSIVNPNARLNALAAKNLVKSNGASGYTGLQDADMVLNKEYIAVYNEDISTTTIIIENPEFKNLDVNNLAVKGKFSLTPNSTAQVISSGSIVGISSNIKVDTESSAAIDNLDSITGGISGQIITLSITNNARQVLIRNGIGNIINPEELNIFLKNINDVATLKYDGTNWAVMSYSGQTSCSSKLLLSQTASSSASIDFIDLATNYAGYKSYEFRFINVLPATSGVGLWGRVSTDNGATFITTNYLGNLAGISAGAAGDYTMSTNAIGMLGNFAADANWGAINTAAKGISGQMTIFDPASSSTNKVFIFRVAYTMTGAFGFANSDGGGIYNGSTTAINAMRFLMSSGNIASGTIEMWGYK